VTWCSWGFHDWVIRRISSWGSYRWHMVEIEEQCSKCGEWRHDFGLPEKPWHRKHEEWRDR